MEPFLWCVTWSHILELLVAMIITLRPAQDWGHHLSAIEQERVQQDLLLL